MRIVMMGTGGFAVPTLEHLHDSSHHLAALVTRRVAPPAARARQPANPMRAAAQQMGIPILDPPNANAPQFVAQLRQLAADLLVVCDFGTILSRDCLAAARLGGINLHGSLLPKYRGAAPVQWAVYDGQSRTGVSVIHMSARLDAGPCLVQHVLEILPEETAEQLERRLAQLGPPAISAALDMLARWDGEQQLGTPQDSGLATSARRLKKSDGQIHWNRSAIELCNQIRAFQPWPGSFTHWTNRQGQPVRLILHQAQPQPCSPPAADPGKVVTADGAELSVQTGQGVLVISRLQPAGRRAMSAEEFLRGYPLEPGDQLESSFGHGS